MSRIFKYPLSIESTQVAQLPIGARILTIKEQEGVPTLWAVVDQTELMADVQVKIVATGEEFEIEPWRYITTLVMENGLVWHVFMCE
jgi:hypothetical protein